MQVVIKAQEFAEKVASEQGVEVVEVTYKQQIGGKTLTIYIYKPEGIGLNDCEKFSKAMDVYLDENDITSGEFYNLNVSSPGLDRPIKTKRDFLRNLNKAVEVKLINGESLNGTIESADEIAAIIKQPNDSEVKINYSEIKNCYLELNFKGERKK